MLIPYQSLKKHLDFHQPIQEIAALLTMLGLEVDATYIKKPEFSGVIVAKITEIIPLREDLSQVTIWDGSQNATVVTSAKNCKVGALVPWAKPRSSFFGEKVEVKDFFGTTSQGFLLSIKELKLGENGEGIWLIEGEASIGIDLGEYFSQQVLEISLTPNLGHCQSILGIARELSAALCLPLKVRNFSIKKKPSPFKISIQSDSFCSSYHTLFLEQIEVKNSTSEVIKELFGLGQMAFNNVIDAANLVMFDLGQPLHPFDADLIQKNLVIQKISGQIEAIDQVIYKLEEDDLAITSDKEMIAIAGMIGGDKSKVTATTKSICVESAIFNSKQLRMTSKRLGLRTQAYTRFEKGVDPAMAEKALHYFGSLLGYSELAISQKTEEIKEKKICFRFERCNEILGANLAVNQIENLLKRLGFSISSHSKEGFVTIPSYRHDIYQEIDLIEEVGRLYGYKNLPKQLPSYQLDSTLDDPLYTFGNKVRNLLLRLQLQECITPDLMDANLLKKTGYPIEDSMLVKLKKTTGKQFNTLRPSMIPSLFQVANHNFAKGSNQLAIFEIGKIHLKDQNHFLEPTLFTILLAEKKAKTYHLDFFDLKGRCESLFKLLGIEIQFKHSSFPIFHPYLQASIHFKSLQIGEIGMLHPSISEHQLWFAECSLEDVQAAMQKNKAVETPSIYPSTTRDLTLRIDKKHSYQAILDFIKKQPSNYLQATDFLDIYHPKSLTEKSRLTLRFTYKKKGGTLQFNEAQQEHDQITKLLTAQFN